MDRGRGIDMSRQTVTIVKCDLCGKEENVRHLKYPVLFTTDQTEGRGCTPYISHKELDLCDECIDKVIKITGWGHKDITITVSRRNRYERMLWNL